MKKLLKIIVAVLVVVLALALVGEFAGGLIIKNSVNTVGPRVLGVPLTLQHAALSPFRGKVMLKGLRVGNPEGFKTPALFDMGLLDIDLDMASLFKSVITISNIRIEAPQITYERALKNSNIGQLLDQLGGEKPAAAPDKKEAAPESGEKPAGKKVVIRKLTISGATVNASVTALGGKALVLPLPPITLTNIGGEGDDAQGVTFLEAFRDIIGAVFKSVSDVLAGSGKLAVDGAKAVGGAAADGAQAAGSTVAEGAQAAGSAAADGAKAVGSVAADGVEAIGSGAGKAVDAATGLFKKDTK